MLLLSGSSIATACEGKELTLNCGPGQKIDVVSANYGRQNNNICVKDVASKYLGNTDCGSSNSLAVVQRKCQGSRSCSLAATNTVFGDSCNGTYKYLEVNYACSGT